MKYNLPWERHLNTKSWSQLKTSTMRSATHCSSPALRDIAKSHWKRESPIRPLHATNINRRWQRRPTDSISLSWAQWFVHRVHRFDDDNIWQLFEVTTLVTLCVIRICQTLYGTILYHRHIGGEKIPENVHWSWVIRTISTMVPLPITTVHNVDGEVIPFAVPCRMVLCQSSFRLFSAVEYNTWTTYFERYFHSYFDNPASATIEVSLTTNSGFSVCYFK